MRSPRLTAPRLLGGLLALAFSIAPPVLAEEVPGDYPQTSTRLLTPAEVAEIRPDYLSMMRNEVFARHGHRFKTESLAAHFNRQPWYKAQVDDAGPLLTEIERKNVALIRQVEKQAKEAERAKEAAAERAAWAALPADVQGFWAKFRAALDSRDAARISALVADNFKDGLKSPGHSQRVSRSGFAGDIWTYMSDLAVQRIQRRSPLYEKGTVKFNTGELAEDPFCAEGRLYMFKGKNGHYRLVGIFINAGPGEYE